jgi:phenylalanyl-tRNA synthetase beta chain
MLLDSTTDVGARNERRLAALYAGATAGFEVIHGLVNRLMLLLEIPPRPFSWEAGAPNVYGRGGLRYHIERDASVPSYFPGRGARIVVTHESGRSLCVGSLGVLHPHVLSSFDIPLPVSVVELSVEPFL